MVALRVSRQGTASELAALNATGRNGDHFFETDTKAVKIADGATAYNSLPYGASAIGFATSASNFNTTSTSYVDVLTLTYTPTTATVLITVAGMISNDGANACYFQVLCSNAATGKLGNAQEQAGIGAQVAISGMTQFTGLTPGTSYTFKIQVKVSVGTCSIRTASFPENERISIRSESV